jgi:two-component system, LytTR family, response regulator
MKLSPLIVDDEPLGREAVRSLLAQDPQVADIGEAATGAEAIERIRERKHNLVFLDVQMPDIDGFSILQKANVDSLPAVVFVTAYEQYAIDAFERNAIDYLLKPFTADRFAKMMARVKSHLHAKSMEDLGGRLATLEKSLTSARYLSRVAVKTAGKAIFVRVEDMDWIEAAEDYVQLHVGKATYLLHANLGGLAARLDPEMFLRVHRSVIVNVHSILELHPEFHGEYLIRLKDGTELHSGRTYNDSLKRLVSNSV